MHLLMIIFRLADLIVLIGVAPDGYGSERRLPLVNSKLAGWQGSAVDHTGSHRFSQWIASFRFERVTIIAFQGSHNTIRDRMTSQARDEFLVNSGAANGWSRANRLIFCLIVGGIGGVRDQRHFSHHSLLQSRALHGRGDAIGAGTDAQAARNHYCERLLA